MHQLSKTRVWHLLSDVLCLMEFDATMSRMCELYFLKFKFLLLLQVNGRGWVNYLDFGGVSQHTTLGKRRQRWSNDFHFISF